MAAQIFFELSVIVIAAVMIAAAIRLLKQPLIIGYILTGILVGPYFLGIVQSKDTIELFAHIGIALLLFMVGVKLNPKVIKEVGKVSLITGVGQIIFTTLIGYAIAIFLGFSPLVSIYIALALAFSSTIIIMKLLSDKGDLETLYGRIAIGFLIVQDLIAIVILMLISSMSTGADMTTFALETVLKGVGLIVAIFLTSLYVFPRMGRLLSRSQEFLLLFSIGWCFFVSSLFYYLNFSIESGALMAGLSFSLSPYRHEISYKLRPLRDFFLIMFFIFLGSQMVFVDISQYILPAVVFSLFILIGNPLIVMALMGMLRFTKRNSFMAGLTVAQISEFSLVLIALGVSLGHLPMEILSLVTIVGMITIAGSTYVILYSHRIYPLISRHLGVFEKRGRKVDEHRYHLEESYDTILFGYNRIGYDLLKSLKRIRDRVLVVDYNPETVMRLASRGHECKYGDVEDPDMLDELNLEGIKMAVSTIPSVGSNIVLIKRIRQANKNAIIAVVSHQIEDALILYEAGASYVLLPHFLGGRHMSAMIEKYGLNRERYMKEKADHIKHLRIRKELGHEHPRPEKNE